MRILILGSGAREHAIAWKLSKEIGKENVFIAPGNGGTQMCGTNVDCKLTDFKTLKEYCVSNNINTVIPGSEEAIAEGVRDNFESDPSTKNIYVFSPDQHAGKLESSKSFAKEFMSKQDIPTAAYQSFTKDNVAEGFTFLESLNPPYVLKADGLAAGKGVLIIDNLEEAKSSLEDMLVNEKFGEASTTVVIEEFLDGIEFSVFVITDGSNYVLLPEAKDYKRIGEGDQGLNTGGMGAVSPVPFFNSELKQKTIEQVIEPTIKGFASQNLNYRGFVFFGLIVVNNNPYVIEYNVRMGDPETEVVIPRVNESLSDILSSAKNGSLKTKEVKTLEAYCTTVFSVSGGYPEHYEKGKEVRFTEQPETLFHAGTKERDGKILTNGGRVLAACGFGPSLKAALDESYKLTNSFTFENRVFRTDIGQDLKKYL